MVHLLSTPLTYPIKLLKGVSILPAVFALSLAAPEAKSQSLSAIQQTSISGTAEFNLQAGESFNVSADTIQQTANDDTSITNIFKPFETTVGSGQPGIIGGLRTQGDDPATVGNAGQSSLVLIYDRDGFLPIQEVDPDAATTNPPTTRNVIGNGSITAVAGITPFGGDRLSGGLSLTNVPSNIRLNQDLDEGLPGIEFVSFASTSATANTVQNGASIITTLTGASSIGSTLLNQSSLVNSLSVSAFD